LLSAAPVLNLLLARSLALFYRTKNKTENREKGKAQLSAPSVLCIFVDLVIMYKNQKGPFSFFSISLSTFILGLISFLL
jgi:hypothetical protein